MAIGADAGGRDHVAGEGQAGQRVADRGGAELAAALRLRGHDEARGGSLLPAEPLVVREGEELVSGERSAQRAAELVLLEPGLGLRRGGEEVLGLEGIVAVELPRRAVPRVGAGPRHHAHDRARVPSVLRVVGMGEDLELLDRVGGRAEDEPRVEGVVVGRSVEDEVVRLVPHAVDVESTGHVAEAAGSGVAGGSSQPDGGRDHARDERSELGEAAAVQGQVDDLLLVDDDAEGGVAGLHERRIADHGDVLGEVADGEPQVHARGLRDVDADALAHQGTEPLQAAPDVVEAGGQEGDGIEAVGAGRHAAREPGPPVRGFHRRSRHRRARGVGNDAGDGARRLRVGAVGHERQEDPRRQPHCSRRTSIHMTSAPGPRHVTVSCVS